MNSASHCYSVFETAMGFCGIGWSDAGITSFRLPTASAQAAERLILRHVPRAKPGEAAVAVKEVVAAAKRYFGGAREDFCRYPLDLGEQEAFFRDVYAFVRALPWGETTTYGAVAKALGARPEAARDVGQAMAKNPTPLIIPCHRVLAAGGRIGGFSATGGSMTKIKMLLLEGVNLAQADASQPSFGF